VSPRNALLYPTILTLVFPYIGPYSRGVQPYFFLLLLLYTAIFDGKIFLRSIGLFITLALIELIISVIVKFDMRLLRFDLIFLCATILTLNWYGSFGNYLEYSKRATTRAVAMSILLLLVMVWLYFMWPSAASSINLALAGEGQLTGGRGVSFFVPEPGFGAFSVLTIATILIVVEGNKFYMLSLIRFCKIVFALAMTLTLTAAMTLCLYFIATFKVVRWRASAIIGVSLFIIVGILFLRNELLDLVEFPWARFLQLIDMQNNPDGSPALRTQQILDYIELLPNSLFLYANENIFAVGFISYLSQIPMTTIVFLGYFLFKLSKYTLPLFVLCIILLPLAHPFFIIIGVIDDLKKQRTSLNLNNLISTQSRKKIA
jgi:hypothetical protein